MRGLANSPPHRQLECGRSGDHPASAVLRACMPNRWRSAFC